MAVPLSDIDPLRPLLARRPLGLASDIDGTLAPIVPRPEDAAVSPACRKLLGALVAHGVRVALVTGRSLETARRMVDMEGVAFAANHGLSLWVDGREEAAPGAAEYVELARQAMAELSCLEVPGVTLEDKEPVLAVHYRRAADREAARQAVLRAIEASPGARGFRVQEGRMVVELRPRLVGVDKGTALAELVRRLGVASLVCLGDDTTDIDMFRTAARLREEGLPAATVAVRSEEATAEVLASADWWVDGVEGVEWLLGEVLRALP